ncbi:hypothetical protein [Paenibacillus sp. RC67]|uniref:hypothetical protein n=1 Tax=Paenibacillus sp. RC67 TaxID=3039392 RepID=UPI0024AC8CF9|nr:hypothetical protein [Paenibacillus sp. RC67]
MRSYWLAPVLFEGESVLLSADRFELLPRETGERFLQWVKLVHPRLLVPFKSNLLLSEDAEIRCGVDQLPFELESGAQIIFSPELLELSHCAQAYIDKRPIGNEMGNMLQKALDQLGSEASDEPIAGWLHTMKKWNEAGYRILLLS